MKWTPQKTMSVAWSLSAAKRASLNESPIAVGPADDLVPLVVVTEDQQAVAERGLGRRDAGDDLVVRREGVVVREWNLKTQHVGPPRDGVAPQRPAGGSPVASTAGVSASERGLCEAGYRAGRSSDHNTHVEWKHSRAGGGQEPSACHGGSARSGGRLAPGGAASVRVRPEVADEERDRAHEVELPGDRLGDGEHPAEVADAA